MLQAWRRFTRLSTAQKCVAMESALLLPATALGLRLLGLERMLRLVDGSPSREQSVEFTPEQYFDLLSAVARRAFPRGRCLVRSLALYWLLHRHGIAGDLRIGVRFLDGRLHAHAWVELKGVVLDSGNPRQDFSTLEETVSTACR